MRQIYIDLTSERARPPAQAVGYVGEHNATELLISVPRALIDASDYQTVVFQSGSLIFRSRRIYGDSDRNGAYREGECIHCLLGRHLTEEQRLGLQVEAYKLGENSEPVLVGKTAFIPRLTLMASPQGRPGLGFDGGFDDISRAIADAHRHDNAIPISKLTEDAAGNPVYGGKPLGGAGQLIVQTYDDLPLDKPTGTVARTLETSEGLFTGVVTSLQDGYILDVVEISENIAFNGVSSAEEPEGLELYLEDESGNYYRILIYMFNLDGNPILIYEYGFEGESESSYVLYVYTPDSFTAPEDFGFLEFSAGWNLLDFDVPSAAPVAHSELPGIPDNMEVGGVGEEAGLVYPHLRITSYVVNPAGEYVFNGEYWVYQDYAYKAELDSKVDKEDGKGLSEYNYSWYDMERVNRIQTWGDGTYFLANDGNYHVVEIESKEEIKVVQNYNDMLQISDAAEGDLVYVVNGDAYHCNGYYCYIFDDNQYKWKLLWTKKSSIFTDADRAVVSMLSNFGDGDKVLTDDGTYKSVIRVSKTVVIPTESWYAGNSNIENSDIYKTIIEPHELGWGFLPSGHVDLPGNYIVVPDRRDKNQSGYKYDYTDLFALHNLYVRGLHASGIMIGSVGNPGAAIGVRIIRVEGENTYE